MKVAEHHIFCIYIIKSYFGWYERVAKHNDIDPRNLPEIEKVLEQKLKTSGNEYKSICKVMLELNRFFLED